MTESSAAQRLEEEELAQIVEDFEKDVRAGHVPSVEQWALRFPKHADQIRELFPGLLLIEHTASGLRTAQGPVSIPESVGPFPVLRELGRGGMGVVYLAKDPKLDRRVALKVFDIRGAKDDRFLKRFFREARAAGGLSHPHIVPVFDNGQADGFAFYSMQFIDGFALDDCLLELRRSTPSGSGRKPASDVKILLRDMKDRAQVGMALQEEGWEPPVELDWAECTRICREAGEGLVHAHSQGILHRDVKPGNILLDQSGHAWVTDFGLCHWEGEVSMTKAGEVVGTLRYMAPEQLEGEPDERSDVYSLGLVLYELVTGREAFNELRKARLVKNIISVNPTRPRKVNPSIPRDLETIILKATAKLPGERYASAAALVRDLQAFDEGRPLQARPPSTWYLTALLIRRHKLVTAVALLALFMAGLLTFLYTQSLQREREQRTQGEYNARLAAAESALNSGSVGRGMDQLQLAPERYRGWEWYHLVARIDQSLTKMRVGSSHARDVVYSPDGNYVATASTGGAHILRIVEDQLQVHRFIEGNFNAIDWTESGDGMMAIRDRGNLYLVPLDLEAEIEEFTRGPSRAVTLDIYNGKRLIVSTEGGLISSYDRELGQWAPLTRRVGDIAGFDVLPDKSLWVMDIRGWQTTWDTLANKGPEQWVGHHRVGSAALALDGGRVFYLTEEGMPEWRSIANPDKHGAFAGAAIGMEAIGISPDSGSLVAGGSNRLLQLWKANSGEPLGSLSGHPATIEAIEWRPDNRRIVSGDRQGYVHIWHPRIRGGRIEIGHHFYDVSHISVSHDGTHALTAGRDGAMMFWDLRSASMVRAFWEPTSDVNRAMFLEGESVGLGLSAIGEISAWDLGSGERLFFSPKEERAMKGYGGGAYSEAHRTVFVVTRNPDGQSGSWIEEWSSATWKQVRKWHLPRHAITNTQFHDSLGKLICITAEGALLVLDPDAQRVIREIPVQPDGKRLWQIELDTSDSRALLIDWLEGCYLVDLEGKKPTKFLRHTQGVIHYAAFLSGQNRMVGAMRSGHLGLWDLETGQHLTDIDTQRDGISSVACDPTGSLVISGGSHGTVQMYDTKTSTERLAFLEHPSDEDRGMTRLEHGRLAIKSTLRLLRSGTEAGYQSARVLDWTFTIRNRNVPEIPCLLGAMALFRNNSEAAVHLLDDVIQRGVLDQELAMQAKALLYWAYWRHGDRENALASLPTQDLPSLYAWKQALDSTARK